MARFVLVWVVACCFTAIGSVYGETVELDALLEEATEGIAEDYRDTWAYTETSKTSKGLFVSRYDPRAKRGNRWTLVSVNGRDPKSKETKEFLKEKSKEEERADSDDGSGPAAFTEGVEKLSLVKETDEFWLLSFQPKGQGDQAKIMKKLNGRFKILKDGRVLDSITMSNSKPFKPSFTTKIYQFFMHYGFGPATQDGPLVPQKLDFNIEMKAVGVLKVNEKIKTTYSDYEFVGG